MIKLLGLATSHLPPAPTIPATTHARMAADPQASTPSSAAKETVEEPKETVEEPKETGSVDPAPRKRVGPTPAPKKHAALAAFDTDESEKVSACLFPLHTLERIRNPGLSPFSHHNTHAHARASPKLAHLRK